MSLLCLNTCKQLGEQARNRKGRFLIPWSLLTGRMMRRPGPYRAPWQQSHTERLQTERKHTNYLSSLSMLCYCTVKSPWATCYLFLDYTTFLLCDVEQIQLLKNTCSLKNQWIEAEQSANMSSESDTQTFNNVSAIYFTYLAKTFLTDSGRASLSLISSPSTKVKAHISIKRCKKCEYSTSNYVLTCIILTY